MSAHFLPGEGLQVLAAIEDGIIEKIAFLAARGLTFEQARALPAPQRAELQSAWEREASGASLKGLRK